MADEVKIPVSLPGAAQAAADAGKVAGGLNQIAKGADAAKGANQDQGKAANAAAKGLNELGEASEKGAALGRIFREVLSGNIGALGQLGVVLKASGAAAKASVFGLILIPASALLAILPTIVEWLRKSSDASQDSGEKTKKAFEESKAAVEKLNQAKLDNLKAQLDQINQSSQATLALFNQITSAEQQIDDARTNLELARVATDTSLSPEEKKAREFEIRQGAADRRAGRQNESASYAAEVEADRARKLADTAAPLEVQRDALQKQVDGIFQNRRQLEQERQAIANERQAVEAPVQFTNEGEAVSEEQLKRLESFRQREERLKAREETSTGPAADVRLENLSKQLMTAERAANEARQRATEAERRAQEMREGANIGRDTGARVRGLERETARTQAGLPEPVSRPAGPLMDTVERPGQLEGAVVDGAALAAQAREQGGQTGAQIAESMAEAIRARDAALLDAFKRGLAGMDQKYNELRDQVRSSRR